MWITTFTVLEDFAGFTRTKTWEYLFCFAALVLAYLNAKSLNGSDGEDSHVANGDGNVIRSHLGLKRNLLPVDEDENYATFDEVEYRDGAYAFLGNSQEKDGDGKGGCWAFAKRLFAVVRWQFAGGEDPRWGQDPEKKRLPCPRPAYRFFELALGDAGKNVN
jgi:hypothetical protein